MAVVVVVVDDEWQVERRARRRRRRCRQKVVQLTVDVVEAGVLAAGTAAGMRRGADGLHVTVAARRVLVVACPRGRSRRSRACSRMRIDKTIKLNNKVEYVTSSKFTEIVDEELLMMGLGRRFWAMLFSKFFVDFAISH